MMASYCIVATVALFFFFKNSWQYYCVISELFLIYFKSSKLILNEDIQRVMTFKNLILKCDLKSLYAFILLSFSYYFAHAHAHTPPHTHTSDIRAAVAVKSPFLHFVSVVLCVCKGSGVCTAVAAISDVQWGRSRLILIHLTAVCWQQGLWHYPATLNANMLLQQCKDSCEQSVPPYSHSYSPPPSFILEKKLGFEDGIWSYAWKTKEISHSAAVPTYISAAQWLCGKVLIIICLKKLSYMCGIIKF